MRTESAPALPPDHVTKVTKGAVDDRGQPIGALNLADVKRAERDPNKRRALLARRLRDAIRVESQRGTWRRVLVVLGFVIAAQVIYAVLVYNAPSFRGLPITWISIIAAILVLRFWARRESRSNLARTAVAEGLCGACAYSLQDLPQEPDGCLKCPECGAAWRPERITRPHWAEAALVGYDPPWWKRTVFNIPRPRDLLAPDDRGRFVTIMDSYLKLLPPARRAEWGRPRVRALRRQLRTVGAMPRAILAVVMTFPCILLAIMVATFGQFNLTGPPNRIPPEMWYTIGFFVAIGLVIGFAFYRSNRFGPPRKLTPVFRAASVCASCGADLPKVPAADGCVDCPECGAGWRLDGVAEQTPIENGNSPG